MARPTRWKLRNFTCSAHDAARSDVLAHEVLSGLWLGNRRHAASKDWIEKHNVRFILNVAHEVPCAFAHCGTIDYLHLLLRDARESESVTLEELERGYAFLQRGLASGAGVLVHCWAGRSRSAAFVVYALSRSTGVSVAQAMQTLATVRPFICVHAARLEQVAQKRADDRGDAAVEDVTASCSAIFTRESQCGCSADTEVWSDPGDPRGSGAGSARAGTVAH